MAWHCNELPLLTVCDNGVHEGVRERGFIVSLDPFPERGEGIPVKDDEWVRKQVRIRSREQPAGRGVVD